ncbi:MAG: TolC family protein [Candidatus Omnitrophica bacterium]|nr:TolC family protein [Candidatus Omnitrophota bacterium]
MNKRNSFFHCLMLLVIVCSGCSTVSQPTDPSQSWTPSKWAEKKLAKDEVWRSLRAKGDVFTGGDRLDIAALLDIAFTNNPSTRQAWESARAAHARIKQAESRWYPQVSVSAQTAFNKKVTNNSVGDANQADYTALGQAQLLLLDLGGRAARVSSAKQALLEANFSFNQAIQDVFLDTTKAYYGLYSAEASVVAAEANLADSTASLDAARQRAKAGLVSRLDVLQAESTYEDSLYSLEEARGLSKTARATLTQALGVPPDTEFEIDEPSGDILVDVTEEDVTVLIDRALKERPSVIAAKASLESKKEDLAAANSDLWPTLSTGGSIGAGEHKFFGSEKNPSVFNSKWDHSYNAFLTVEWDVFDGFYLYSKRNEAKALLGLEREKLRQVELAASAEVWTKYFDLKTAEKKYSFSKAFLETSKTSYELAYDSYTSGLKSMLDVLQAQSQLSEARSRMISSRESLFVSRAELAHAIGALTVTGNDKEGRDDK